MVLDTFCKDSQEMDATKLSLAEQLWSFLAQPRFEAPLFLSALILPIVLFVLWRQWERRHAVPHADEARIVPAPRWLFIVRKSGEVAFLAGALSAVIATALPQGEYEESLTHVEVHKGCIVFDVSGSMSLENKEAVAAPAREFVARRSGDAFCVVPFHDTVVTKLILPLTKDAQVVSRHLSEIKQVTGGSTALGDGLFYATKILIADVFPGQFNSVLFAEEIMQKRNEDTVAVYPYTEEILNVTGGLKHSFVLALTDGQYNAGVIDTLKLLEVQRRLGIRVYVLGVGVNLAQDMPDFAEQVRRTKGAVLYAASPKDLGALLEEVSGMQKRKVVHKSIRKRYDLDHFFLAFAGVCALVFFLTRAAPAAFYAFLFHSTKGGGP